jgi:hypothetical protein
LHVMDAQNALAKSRDVETTSSKFILHFSSNISRRMKPHIDINVKSKATNSIWRYQYSGLSTLYVASILFRGTSLARSCKSPRYFHDTQFWLISRRCVYHIGTKELSLSRHSFLAWAIPVQWHITVRGASKPWRRITRPFSSAWRCALPFVQCLRASAGQLQ